MLKAATRYAKDHWQGDQGLAWSFWINLIALRTVLFIAQANALPAKGEDYSAFLPLILAFILIFHVLLFVWQAVGVLRPAEKHLADTGSQASVWGAQITLVAGVFLTFSAGLEAWQTTIPVSKEENHMVRMDREHASKYKLVLNPETKTVSIDGSIELGITRNLRNLLLNNPGTRLAIINSDGGNIYEARGLAKLFRDNAINTRVDKICTSACTTAFTGGKTRTMGPDAKFGFHQYRIDSAVRTINADPAAEQQKDMELFRKSGVSDAFVERMFLAPANDMWFPTSKELVQSGYIHQISN